MKIGELARRANCTPDTIRFYEKEGLLPETHRTEANYRTYDQEHINRLRFIRNCRALDMSHEEVRTLLHVVDGHSATCDAINSLVDAHIEHVNRQIDELLEQREQLTVLRARCCGKQPADACGILQELASRQPRKAKMKTPRLG